MLNLRISDLSNNIEIIDNNVCFVYLHHFPQYFDERPPLSKI